MKPRVAIFDFACCEGCELQIVNLEEDVVGLVSAVDVVSFREAMKEHSDTYDIAIVEGSITRQSDEARLKKIRQNAKILIALGACACISGINALKNTRNLDVVKKTVYGDKADWFETYPARPIDAVVPVDYYVRGCPIEKNEVLSVVKSLLLGKQPEIPNYPVCVECKLAENQCVFEKGMFCLGPVTRAGCSARCPSAGNICIGCRGLVDNPNKESEREVLERFGLSVNDIVARFTLFGTYQEVSK
jgi:coenzyme F420-reducing hydrogenase gamma subunit